MIHSGDITVLGEGSQAIVAESINGGGALDDLDAQLVELADERLLLETGQLMRLDDVAHIRGPNRPRVLARVEKRSEVVLGQQAFDVDGRHRGEGGGTTTSYPAGFHSLGALDKPHTGEIAIWRSRRSSVD